MMQAMRKLATRCGEICDLVGAYFHFSIQDTVVELGDQLSVRVLECYWWMEPALAMAQQRHARKFWRMSAGWSRFV